MTDEAQEKCKVIYEYARNQFNEEIDRSHKLDDKAAKLVSLLTVMVAAYGFFGKWLIDAFPQPSCFWDYLVVGIGFLAGLVLALSWLSIIKVIPIFKYKKPPCDRKTFKSLDQLSLMETYVTLAVSYAETKQTNRVEVENKAWWLDRAHYATTAAAILFVILIGLYTWHVRSLKPVSSTETFCPCHGTTVILPYDTRRSPSCKSCHNRRQDHDTDISSEERSDVPWLDE